jgi:hypothetical protein
MKVVTETAWTKTVKCKSCGSTLLIEEQDVRIGQFGACYYAGDSGESGFYANCGRPGCGATNRLSNKDVPDHVQAMACRKR